MRDYARTMATYGLLFFICLTLILSLPSASAHPHGRTRSHPKTVLKQTPLSEKIPSEPYYPHPTCVNATSSSNCIASDLSTVDRVTDCALKTLALVVARKILKSHHDVTTSPLQQVFNALELGVNCNEAPVEGSQQVQYSTYFPTQPRWASNDTVPQQVNEKEQIVLFVDSSNGDDANSGSQASPFHSLLHAVETLRSRRAALIQAGKKVPSAMVYLRQGMYFFDQTLKLDERDSFTTFKNFEDEEVVFSGGVNLSKLKFKVYSGSILVADLPPNVDARHEVFNELFLGGRRISRARYPNGNPETQGLWTPEHTGYIHRADKWLPPLPPSSPGFDVITTDPTRLSWNFPHFQEGVGGAAEVFDPPRSFWATANPPAGVTYQVPSGLQYSALWMNNSLGTAKFDQAVVHAFHSMYWGNWLYQVSHVNSSSQTIHFAKGGFQEARGNAAGAEWFLENLLTELDQANEWYLDQDTRQLYFFPNLTASTTSMSFDESSQTYSFDNPHHFPLIASQQMTIVSVSGVDHHRMAQEIHFQNIVFSHTAASYLQKHEVPSGGDWSTTRLGALQFEWVRSSTVAGCLFVSLGGNGVIVSRGTFDVRILGNEFVWLGSSAILVIGQTQGIDGYIIPSQPRRTMIEGNLIHEIGIWVKQSAAVGIFLSYSTNILQNICFNTPRACVNINDGFGGGHLIRDNLFFNTVRETDDHGPINTWDRQVYLMRSYVNGEFDSKYTLTIQPFQSFIHRNFLLNNYAAVWPIDHDDGSQWYTDSDNYLVYGGYKSYLGNSLNVMNNVYVLPDGKVQLEAVWSEWLTQSSVAAEKLTDDSVPPMLKQLPSVIQKRVRNMYQRYIVSASQLKLTNTSSASTAKRVQPLTEKQESEEDSFQRWLMEEDMPMEEDQPQLAEADSIVDGEDRVTQQLTGRNWFQRNWGQYCVQDGGGYGHAWFNNTCATMSLSNAYNLWACQILDLPLTIPSLSGNTFYGRDTLNVTCQGLTVSFQEFQAMGYDIGSQVLPPASLQDMMQWGRKIFDL